MFSQARPQRDRCSVEPAGSECCDVLGTRRQRVVVLAASFTALVSLAVIVGELAPSMTDEDATQFHGSLLSRHACRGNLTVLW